MNLSKVKEVLDLDIDGIVARAEETARAHTNVRATIEELCGVANALAERLMEKPKAKAKTKKKDD